MVRGRWARAVVGAVLLGLLAVACTEEPDPAPSPTPSADDATASAAPRPPPGGEVVTVVVPPANVVAPAEAAALARAARDLAADPPAGVRTVQVVEAASAAFARDLANLAADDGDDVVCIVGTGAAELALELARARRDTRFCATDARVAGGPVNLVAAAPDPSLLVAAGAAAIGVAPAPVGLLTSPQLGDQEALATAFTGAMTPPLEQGLPGSSAIADDEPSEVDATSPASPTPGATPSAAPAPTPFALVAANAAPAAQAASAELLAAAGPSRVLVLATPGGSAVGATLGGAGSVVVGVSDWLVDAEGALPAGTLVALTVDWPQVLRAAIDAARDEEATQVRLLGAAEGAVGVVAGQSEGAGDAAVRALAVLAPPEG